MEFGPEIKVDGKRPEWLKDDDWFISISDGDDWSMPYKPSGIFNFDWLSGIRLPLGDARYANLTTHTYTIRPEGEAAFLASDPLSRSTPDERAVAPELVERMRALVKTIGNDNSEPYSLRHVEDEARAILAALEPVDGDLAVAREICAEQSIATEHYDDQLSKDLANAFRRGSYDEGREMRIAINSLARGRQLEKEGK